MSASTAVHDLITVESVYGIESGKIRTRTNLEWSLTGLYKTGAAIQSINHSFNQPLYLVNKTYTAKARRTREYGMCSQAVYTRAYEYCVHERVIMTKEAW